MDRLNTWSVALLSGFLLSCTTTDVAPTLLGESTPVGDTEMMLAFSECH